MENFCPGCGQPNQAEAQFCRFCASPMAGANRQHNYRKAQNNQTTDGASGRAITSLVLTICGLLLCCVLTSVPGAILGWMEINAIKQGQSSPKGMTMAQIGLWGGAAIAVINLLFYGFYLLAVLSAGMDGGY